MKKITVTKLCMVLLLVLICLSSVAEADSNQAGYEFYFMQLNKNQQAMYRVVQNAPPETAVYTVVLPEKAASEAEASQALHTVMETVKMDHPESMAWLFWFEDFSYNDADNSVTFELCASDYYDADDQELSERLLDAIAAAADPSWDLYTKAQFTTNVVRDALDYDWKYVFYPENGKADYYNSTIHCVNNGYAICGGFSKLYKAIADRIGLPCVEVGSVGHAWVHVQMEDGNWYGQEPQNPLYLQGTSTMLNSTFMAPGVDQYELYDEFFGGGELSNVRQPERTAEDYNYNRHPIDPGSVDLTQIRLETSDTATAFTYTVNEDGTTCTITGFSGKESGDLVIPAVIDGYTVTVIGNSAFTYSNFDGRLTLPDTLEEIGNQAFAGCDRLTGQLKLPANLKTIKASAFIGCSGFTGEIIFNDKLERIGRAAISGCYGLTGSLMLPDSLAVLERDSIYDCPGLNGVLHIPTGMSSWSADYVSMCGNLTGFDVSEDHPSYCVLDGILYSRDMTTLLQCFANRTKAVVIPEGVTVIGPQAFYRCTQIPSLSFPSTLKRIENWGCADMLGITEPVVLPSGLEFIGNNALQLCGGIKGTLIIPAGLQLGEGVFGANQAITTVIVEEGVTALPPSTFYFCTGITQVYMPTTIKEIGGNCFETVYGIKVFGTPGTAAEGFVNSAEGRELHAEFYPLTDGYAFGEKEVYLSLLSADNNRTAQIEITPYSPLLPVEWSSSDESVAKVNNGLVEAVSVGQTVIAASFGNTTLQCTVVVHNGVQISADGKTLIRVSDNYCGELVVPEGVEIIKSNAAYNVQGLTGLSLPHTLKEIQGNAFYSVGHTHPFDLTFPESMQLLAEIAVQNCSLQDVQYPLCTKVEQSAFSMSRIENLHIPEGVTALPKTVFQYTYINNCYLPASLISAPYNAFENATVGTFYGYSGTYAEQYVVELQAYYPDKTFTFVSLGAPINHSQYTLREGDSVQLIWQDNAVWTSSNEQVAKVNETGLVTGVQAGTATITATAVNGISATCVVTVRISGYGDANGDGVVDARDALLVLQYSAGWDVNLNVANADVTGDGMIGISDALKILQDCMGGDIAKAMRALQRMLADLNGSTLEISLQPTDQYVTAGETATFTAAATGDGLKYQWYIDRNDGKGWQKLNNATDAIYVTSTVQADNDGYQYRCVITDAHGAEATTDIAILHVVLDMPNTGDASMPALWLAMCMLSMIGMMILKRRTAVE